jgi:glucokinase
MYLLADIGGTHARFAIAHDDSRVDTPIKYNTSKFNSLNEALNHFCSEQGVEDKPVLLIATAARLEADGSYNFTNGTSWKICANELSQKGWKTLLTVNDFVASARGALVIEDKDRQTLKEGKGDKSTPHCILGPGTGLGYAYMHEKPKGKWYVQETAGARMLATAVTEEQQTIIRLFDRLKEPDTFVSFENLASGRGLPILYKAVCLYNGQHHEIEMASDLFDSPDSPCEAQTLRLFHEFLGLFAHNAIVTGHAYRGLYLDGGLLHLIRENMLFDFNTFKKFMILNPIPYIVDLMDNMPVYVVNDPYAALKGVLELYKDGL